MYNDASLYILKTANIHTVDDSKNILRMLKKLYSKNLDIRVIEGEMNFVPYIPYSLSPKKIPFIFTTGPRKMSFISDCFLYSCPV